MSLHRLLTRLIWFCILPVMLLAVWIAFTHVHRVQAERDLDAASLAANLVKEIDGDLTARIGGLSMLAQSPLADDLADLAPLYREAQGFRQSFGSPVILIHPEHGTLFNTRVPLGTLHGATLSSHGRSLVQAARDTGRPAVGDTFFSPVAKEAVVGIAVPGLRKGQMTFSLGTSIEVRQFQRHLNHVNLPSGWTLALLDSKGQTIARRTGGQAAASDAEVARRVVVQSAVSPWSVVLEIPRPVYLAPLVETAGALLVAILVATVASVFGGTRASRRLAQAVASLANPPLPGAPEPDITEIAAVRRLLDESREKREQADTARLHSEQRFRAVFEQAAVGISLVDPQGRFLAVNQHYCSTTGYSVDELLSMTFQEITPAEDLAIEMEQVRRVLAGEAPSFALEKRYIRKDGTLVWLHKTVALTRHRDGSPDHFISVIEDIQRRKVAETALKASEANLREAQRVARLGSWGLDLQTGQRTWSDEIYRIFGHQPGQPPLTTPEIQQYFTPESWTRLDGAVQAGRVHGTPFECDAEIVREDGTHRWVTVRGEAQRQADGTVRELHGTLQDVTERLEAKEQLRVSDLALKAISQGVLIAGPDGRILSANDAFTTITGYSRAEVLGRTGKILQGPLTDPRMLASIRQAWQQVTDFSGEIRHYRKDGTTFWNEMTISPVCNAQGTPTHFIGIVRDVTERRMAADELEQHRHHLRQLVRSRTTELQNALRESTLARQRLQLEITEHRRTEARLRRTQSTLNQATRIAGLGAWSIELREPDNFTRNPVTWSAEMYRLLGYSPEELPVPTPGHFFSRVHPDDRQRLSDAAQQALAGKGTWEAEYRVVRPDGSERLVTETGEISCDRTGKPITMNGAARDVTEQRHIEQQLRDSEARLHIALEGAGAGSCEWNLDTGEDNWSDELWGLFGLERHAAPPCYATWQKTVHPDDLAPAERIVREALSRSAHFEIEWRVNLPEGTPTRWLLARASPMPEKDGRVLRYHGIAIDITKRKQAELALQQVRGQLEERVVERTAELSAAEAEQRRLNRALRLLSDGNFAMVRATSERQLLDELCRLVVDSGGYLSGRVGRAEQDAEKSVAWLAYSGYQDNGPAPDLVSWDGDHVRGQGPTGTAIRTGATQVAYDCQHGQTMNLWRDIAVQRGYHSVVALPLVTQGQVYGALTLFSVDRQPISQEEIQLLEELAENMAFGLQSLRARSELEDYRQQLEQRVAQRTQEIAALNSELVEKAHEADAANRAKSAFLATMSHEIRTPLNAVIGLTGLLSDSHLDQRQRNYMEKIELSAQALRALIDNVLDFSRIEAGALQLEQAPMSLNAILRNTASVVGIGVRGKPVEVLFDVAPDVPEALTGDALRLQQILLNLTSNAVKFTQAGEIVIAVRCLARDATQADLQISVRDTGIGIPPGQQHQIFELFAQADASTSRIYGGSGLGLAISARLASLMGGGIEVESAPGAGSEFRLRLRVALGSALPEPLDPALAHLRILVIDDHPRARQVLQQTCAGFGWHATTCDSGAAGLAELQRCAAAGQDYDLVLLDARMPDMDGIAMLRQAYATEGLGLPLVVLMVSIFDLEQAVASSDDLDLDGLAVKPLTPDGLLEAVTRAYHGDFAGIPASPGKTTRRLAGLRLLIAEDNPINQEVLGQTLARAGAEVVIAANGREAVEAVRVPGVRFDAVLMDIQMPVMDGYAAAQAIRAEPGQADLPIIAVTAYAQPEDREKSRQAGMTGHLVKPFVIDDLIGILAQSHPAPRGPQAKKPRRAPPEIPTPVPRFTGLDVPAALRVFGGDGRKFGELLRQFLTRHGRDAEEAQYLFSTGDTPGAQRLLHDLRGVAGILQATEVARLAQAIEQALLDGKTQGVPQLFGELQHTMGTLAGASAQFEASWVHNADATAPPP